MTAPLALDIIWPLVYTIAQMLTYALWIMVPVGAVVLLHIWEDRHIHGPPEKKED